MSTCNFSDVAVNGKTVLVLRILNVFAFAAVVAINMTGGPGGYGPGDFSKIHPSPITPAGYTFAIWGVIYLGQALMWFVYPFMPFVNKGLIFGRIGFLNAVVCVLNIAWIVLVSYNLAWASTSVLLVQLLLQLVVYYRIHCYDGSGNTVAIRENRTWTEFTFIYLPWALYTSWILAASLISLLIPLQLPTEDLVYPGLVALAFGGIANICILAWSKDVPFALVIIWALFGIFNRQLENFDLIAGASFTSGIVIAGITVIAVTVELLGRCSRRSISADEEPLLPTGM